MFKKNDTVERYDLEVEGNQSHLRPRKRKEPAPKKNSLWGYSRWMGQIGFDIALPLTLGLIIGLETDKRLGTRPKATLLFFTFGCVISVISFIRILRDSSRLH